MTRTKTETSGRSVAGRRFSLVGIASLALLTGPLAACAETARSAGPVLPPAAPLTAEEANCGSFFVGRWSFEPAQASGMAAAPKSVVVFAADGSFMRSDAPYPDGSMPQAGAMSGRWTGTAGSQTGYCVLTETGATSETVEFKIMTQNEITAGGVRGVRLAR